MCGLQKLQTKIQGGIFMSQYTNDLHSLSHTKWNCKYYVVFAPKYRRKVVNSNLNLKKKRKR